MMIKHFILTLLLVLSSTSVFAVPNAAFIPKLKEPIAIGEALNESKSATGTIRSFLSLVTLGEADAGTIAKKAGFNRIHHIDKQVSNFLFLYQEEKIIVYGE